MARRGSKLCGSVIVLFVLAAACGSGSRSGDVVTEAPNAASPSLPAPGDAEGGAPRGTDAGAPAAGDGVLHHVLATGQSNAVGYRAVPVLTTVQQFANLSFDVGVMTSGACDGEGCRAYETPHAFVPLVEGDSYDDGPVETMSSGFANEASRLSAERGGGRHDVLVSVHGRSGWVYECMRKGSCDYRTTLGYLGPFEEGMRQVDDAMTLARAAGRAYEVGAVTVVHGESDHYVPFPTLDGTDGRPGAVRTYADALVEWQRDYDLQIRTRTGQTRAVPMLVSQMANWNDRTTSEIPVRQLEAHVRAPGAVVLVAPTYALPFGPDCIHFTSEGQRTLGAYFAKAYARIVEGASWEPVRPTVARLDGDAVTVQFVVPRPPLVLDTRSVSDPGGLGFVFAEDGAAPPQVTGVEIVAPDTIRVRLSRASTGAAPHLRYALDARPGTCPGPTSGPRGNLRDSDEARDGSGVALPNWAVAFDLALARGG